jgi:HSP20 family protein
MSITLRTGGLVPSLLTDFPSTFFGPDLLDEATVMSPRLGVEVPTANIKESAKEYAIDLAAPGLERKDFNVTVEGQILSISAEKSEEKEEKDTDYSRREFSYNSFCRTFQLPENSKADKIDAHYENGILKVIIPKKEITVEKAAKQIAVQ